MPAVQMKVYQREEIELQVSERLEKGKGDVGRLRREQSMLPGVVYGHNQEPVCFKVPQRTLERALSHGGADAVFMLNMEGSKELERAVVREIQYHKVMDDIVHVDMLRIDPKETLRVEVPIVTEGVPVGVRTGGGALQQTLTRIEMICLASELPSRIEIDISDLEIGDSIHVAELLEQEERINTDPSVTIVSVLSPRLTIDEEIEAAADDDDVEGEEADAGDAEGAAEAAPAEGEQSGEAGN
jgi:large subunit ribosomal protein L25